MIIDASALAAMEQRHRAALINSVIGYKPANLVGTVDGTGCSNLAIMSSAVHLGANPALIMLVLRPAAAQQNTLANILENGCYTLNHINREIVPAAHQTSARYASDISEFTAVGLSEHWHPDFPAPFVAEARVRMGMELREHQTLAINGTQLIIGELVLLEIDEGMLREDYSLDLEKTGSVAISGLDSYYTTEHLLTLPYAKPSRKEP